MRFRFIRQRKYQPQLDSLRQAFDRLKQRHTGEPIRLRLDAAAQAAWQDIYAYLDTVETDEDEGLLVDMGARAPPPTCSGSQRSTRWPMELRQSIHSTCGPLWRSQTTAWQPSITSTASAGGLTAAAIWK